jgi:5-enolpyruvylshikimate-3-phosphate synthase
MHLMHARSKCNCQFAVTLMTTACCNALTLTASMCFDAIQPTPVSAHTARKLRPKASQASPEPRQQQQRHNSREQQQQQQQQQQLYGDASQASGASIRLPDAAYSVRNRYAYC